MRRLERCSLIVRHADSEHELLDRRWQMVVRELSEHVV